MFTKLRIDRIEEGIVIAFSEREEEFHFPLELAYVKENDVCDAVIDEEGKVISLTVSANETTDAKSRIQSKLSKLFNK